MLRYTFKINNLENRMVDAFDLDDALEKAGIAKDDPYELIEKMILMISVSCLLLLMRYYSGHDKIR